MDAREHDNWSAAVHVGKDRPGKLNADICLAASYGECVAEVIVLLDVLHIGEPLSAQEIFSDVLRRLAHTAGLD